MDKPEVTNEVLYGSLTRSGWPRPVVNGWPIPWVSPARNLALMNPARVRRILYNKLCQVCGKKHAKGSTVFICLDADKSYLSTEGQEFHDSYAIPMDHGILHERCFKLAIAFCPLLKAKRASNQLLCLSASIEDIGMRHAVKKKTSEKDFVIPVKAVTLVEI